MAVNLVVQDGIVKSPSLKYDSQSRPELRFTLQQTEYATDGKPWTSYWPCCAAGSTAERLASEIDDGQHILITSGKLCYRKRTTKLGEASRMEILVWTVDVLTDSAEGERSAEASALASEAEPAEPPPAKAPRRRSYPRPALQGGFDQN